MATITLQLAVFLDDGKLLFSRPAPSLPTGFIWNSCLMLSDVGDLKLSDEDDLWHHCPMVTRTAIDLNGNAVVFLQLDSYGFRRRSIYDVGIERSFQETGWQFLRAVEFNVAIKNDKDYD